MSGGAAWGGGAGVWICRLIVLSLVAPADWFMSLGVGLLTFASLETVGIYFGLGKAPSQAESGVGAVAGPAPHRDSPRAGKP